MRVSNLILSHTPAHIFGHVESSLEREKRTRYRQQCCSKRNASMMMLDRSYSSVGASSIGIMLLQSFPALLSFIWSDREVDSSIDTIEEVIIPPIKAYSYYIYTPIVDTTISFNPMSKMISDFNDSQCLTYFRFRPEHLQMIANELWVGLQHFLVGTRQNIKCKRYNVPYETGLCILLF
jgi:hypothetical protein